MPSTYDPEKHSRHSIRLRGYDYARAGAYFVTICVQNRERLLGEVLNGEMSLNEAGQITRLAWEELPKRFPGIGVDVFTVMPNHFHGIIIVGAQSLVSQTRPESGVMNHAPTLGNVVRAFKSVASRRIRISSNSWFAWQRNYYEHIIRNEAALTKARQYIAMNPLRWHLDRENPQRQEDNERDAIWQGHSVPRPSSCS